MRIAVLPSCRASLGNFMALCKSRQGSLGKKTSSANLKNCGAAVKRTYLLSVTNDICVVSKMRKTS